MDAIRGVIRKMFPAKTLKQVIGQNVSISQQMIERIELWAGALWNMSRLTVLYRLHLTPADA